MYTELTQNIYDRVYKTTTSRLEAWAKGVPVNEALTTPLWECICNFSKVYGRNQLKALNLKGWDCGICQMIDISDKDTCAVLPIILVTYIYNFPQNKLVNGWLNKLQTIPSSEKECSFCGVNQEKSYPSGGFGDFLNGEVDQGSRQVKSLAQKFRFPEIIYREYGYNGLYVLPKNLADEFEKNCEIWNFSDTGEIGKPHVDKMEFPDRRYDLYDTGTLYNLFCCLYVEVDRAARKKDSLFSCRPDPKLCYYLLCDIFHRPINPGDYPSFKDFIYLQLSDEQIYCEIEETVKRYRDEIKEEKNKKAERKENYIVVGDSLHK